MAEKVRLSDEIKDWSLSASIQLRLKEMYNLSNQYLLGNYINKHTDTISQQNLGYEPWSMDKAGKVEIFESEDEELAIYYRKHITSPILIPINDEMEFDMEHFVQIAVDKMKPGEAMYFILELINKICKKNGRGLKGEVSLLGDISDALQEKQLIIMQEVIINQLQNEGI